MLQNLHDFVVIFFLTDIFTQCVNVWLEVVYVNLTTSLNLCRFKLGLHRIGD